MFEEVDEVVLGAVAVVVGAGVVAVEAGGVLAAELAEVVLGAVATAVGLGVEPVVEGCEVDGRDVEGDPEDTTGLMVVT